VLHTPTPVDASITDIVKAPAWSLGLLRNDPATVRALYTRHFPTVRQFVLQNSGTLNDAQDMFQEAVAVLWLQLKEGRMQPESDPGGFLFRVARNKWLDTVRSAAHRNMKVVHDERTLDRPIDAPDDVEERIVRLRAVYDKLDDKCRTVLDRFYFERKDLATIAEEMGVEEESIRTIKYRCMMKLRAFRNTIRGEEQEA
jgi:RNA polymerase sigma factor (sigma-70 family)